MIAPKEATLSFAPELTRGEKLLNSHKKSVPHQEDETRSFEMEKFRHH